MQLVPVPADPQQMVAGNHPQVTQLVYRGNDTNVQLEERINSFGRLIVDGIRAIQGLQRDNLALQGRVGELEREKETLEQRVAETENHNQQLSQNLVNVQTENAQLVQRVRNIELEEDAKRVDQLRESYINSGFSRLTNNLGMSAVLSPLFFGSTA